MIKRKSEIPLIDDITLSPIDKYRIYGKFPYAMLIQLILVIFTTLQTLVIISEITDYGRDQEHTFYEVLVNDANRVDWQYQREKYIFSIYIILNKEI